MKPLLVPAQVDYLLSYPPGRAKRLARRGLLPSIELPDGSIRFAAETIGAIVGHERGNRVTVMVRSLRHTARLTGVPASLLRLNAENGDIPAFEIVDGGPGRRFLFEVEVIRELWRNDGLHPSRSRHEREPDPESEFAENREVADAS